MGGGSSKKAVAPEPEAEALFAQIAAKVGRAGQTSLPLDTNFMLGFETVMGAQVTLQMLSAGLDRDQDNLVSLLEFEAFHAHYLRSGYGLIEFLTGVEQTGLRLIGWWSAFTKLCASSDVAMFIIGTHLSIIDPELQLGSSMC